MIKRRVTFSDTLLTRWENTHFLLGNNEAAELLKTKLTSIGLPSNRLIQIERLSYINLSNTPFTVVEEQKNGAADTVNEQFFSSLYLNNQLIADTLYKDSKNITTHTYPVLNELEKLSPSLVNQDELNENETEQLCHAEELQDSYAYSDDEKESINQVYRQLRALTLNYKNEHSNIESPKNNVIDELLDTLNQRNTNHVRRMCNFINVLERSENNKHLDQHRTPAWQRYIANTLSVLTVLPAILRAAKSYHDYRTVCFWKPKSERLKSCAREAYEELADKMNLTRISV